MTSVVKNEVLTKRRSNQFVHSNADISKESGKKVPERRTIASSRIPRDQSRLVGEKRKAIKDSGNKLKSKDIFKYTENYDVVKQNDLPKSVSCTKRDDFKVIKCISNKHMKSKSESVEVEEHDKDTVLKAKVEKSNSTLIENNTPMIKDESMFIKTETMQEQSIDESSIQTNVVYSPHSLLNRSDQENIALEKPSVIREDDERSSKSDECAQNACSIPVQCNAEKSKSLIPKTQNIGKSVTKSVSKKETISTSSKQTKAMTSDSATRNSRSKSKTPSSDCNAPTTTEQVLNEVKTRVNRATDLKGSINKDQPKAFPLRSTNSPISQAKRSVQTRLASNSTSTLSKNVGTMSKKSSSRVKENTQSNVKLSEQLLSKHNQQLRKSENAQPENDDLTRSLTESTTSKTSSLNSSFHSNVSSTITDQMIESGVKERSIKANESSKKKKISKGKPVQVAETKSSVLRRSRSRSITPGASSVSSESSQSHKSSSSSSKSSKRLNTAKEEVAQDQKTKTTDRSKRVGTKGTMRTDGNAENMCGIKSYMKTTESMKNRNSTITETIANSKVPSANKKPLTRLTSNLNQRLSSNTPSIPKVTRSSAENKTREVTTALTVQSKKTSSIPLNESLHSRKPLHMETSLSSKDKQSCTGSLMTSKGGNLEHTLPIKRPISKQASLARRDTEINKRNSAKTPATVSDADSKTKIKTFPPKTVKEGEPTRKVNHIVNKSATESISKPIKFESCKNRPAEHKSKLIAPLPRNPSNLVSKVSKQNSRSLSNKSEHIPSSKIGKLGTAQQVLKSKMHRVHDKTPFGQDVKQRLDVYSPELKKSGRNIADEISCAENNSRDPVVCDRVRKLPVPGKISPGKEKQLLSKGNDEFVNNGHLEGSWELCSSGNSTCLPEILSENTDQSEKEYISELWCFEGGSVNSGDVQFSEKTQDGLDVLNDKYLVSMATVCAVATECNESRENGHSITTGPGSLSCRDRDGHAVNRAERDGSETTVEMESVVSGQVYGTEEQTSNTVGENGQWAKEAYSKENCDLELLDDVHIRLIDSENECILSEENTYSVNSAISTNVETCETSQCHDGPIGDIDNESCDTGIVTSVCDDFHPETIHIDAEEYKQTDCKNESNTTCDTVSPCNSQNTSCSSEKSNNRSYSETREENAQNRRMGDNGQELRQTDNVAIAVSQWDDQICLSENESLKQAIITGTFNISSHGQVDNDQSIQSYKGHETSCFAGDKLNLKQNEGRKHSTYVLVHKNDELRHQVIENGLGSQQTDSKFDKQGYIQYCKTGAPDSKTADNTQNKTHHLSSNSILCEDRAQDRPSVIDNSQMLRNQIGGEVFNGDKGTPNDDNSRELFPDTSHSENEIVHGCYRSLESGATEILDKDDVIGFKKQICNENSCQAIWEDPEVRETFTSKRIEQSDMSDCLYRRDDIVGISRDIEQGHHGIGEVNCNKENDLCHLKENESVIEKCEPSKTSGIIYHDGLNKLVDRNRVLEDYTQGEKENISYVDIFKTSCHNSVTSDCIGDSGFETADDILSESLLHSERIAECGTLMESCAPSQEVDLPTDLTEEYGSDKGCYGKIGLELHLLENMSLMGRGNTSMNKSELSEISDNSESKQIDACKDKSVLNTLGSSSNCETVANGRFSKDDALHDVIVINGINNKVSENTDSLTQGVGSLDISPPLCGSMELGDRNDCQVCVHSRPYLNASSDLTANYCEGNIAKSECVNCDRVRDECDTTYDESVSSFLSKVCDENTVDRNDEIDIKECHVIQNSHVSEEWIDIETQISFEDDSCDTSTRINVAGSQAVQPAPSVNEDGNQSEKKPSTRFKDNSAQVSQGVANLPKDVSECCTKHTQSAVHCSNCSVNTSEICDLDRDKDLSESQNKCNVVKTAVCQEQTKDIPGDHGKLRKTDHDVEKIVPFIDEPRQCDITSGKHSGKSIMAAEVTCGNACSEESDIENSVCTCNVEGVSTDLCSSTDNLYLCQNEGNLEHKFFNKHAFYEGNNKHTLEPSSSTDNSRRSDDMVGLQKEITQETINMRSPTELKPSDVITQMNINPYSADQTEPAINSNMDDNASERSRKCINDEYIRGVSESVPDTACDDHYSSRDKGVMSITGSDASWDLKSYNLNIPRDFSPDQITGLSALVFTSKDSAPNQVFSEIHSSPYEPPVRILTDLNASQISRTCGSATESWTCSKHSGHISNNNDLNRGNHNCKSECARVLRAINSDQSGDSIEGLNFSANNITGNQSRTFDENQTAGLRKGLHDSDYHFIKTQAFEVHGFESDYPEACDQTGFDSGITRDSISGGDSDYGVVGGYLFSVEGNNSRDLSDCDQPDPTETRIQCASEITKGHGYDDVDGQSFGKFDQFFDDAVETREECNLSSIDKDNLVSHAVTEVLSGDNSIRDCEQARIEPNFGAQPCSEKNVIGDNSKEDSVDRVSLGDNSENACSNSKGIIIQNSVDCKSECKESVFLFDVEIENAIPDRVVPFRINKFIKSASSSSFCNKESNPEVVTPHNGSLDNLHKLSLLPLISSKGSIDLQSSSNQICNNAGEALCDNVSDITDIFDDSGDNFVDAEETLDSEIDTTDIDITNSSSCASDLCKQGENPLGSESHDVDADVTSRISNDVKHNTEGDDNISSDIYKCRESIASTESFQDAFDNFVDECSNANTLTDDNSYNNEIDMQQVPPHLFSDPQTILTDSEGVIIQQQRTIIETDDIDDNTSLCTDDKTMERRRRRELSTTTTTTTSAIVTGSSAIMHTHSSGFRTSSAIKDNSYQCNTPSSDFKETQHCLQTNVYRCTDRRNESGRSVIENVIYKTGNGVLPADSCSVMPTGDNEGQPVESVSIIGHGVSSERDGFVDKTVVEKEHVCLAKTKCQSFQTSVSNICESNQSKVESYSDVDDTNSTSTTTCETTKSSFSETNSTNTMETTASVTSSGCIGKKIETAVTIRTQRRRRRQVQTVTSHTEQPGITSNDSKSTEQSETLRDVNAYSVHAFENNEGTDESSKIDSENSSHISSRSQTVTSENNTGSGFESSIENTKGSTLSVSSVPSCSIGRVPGNRELNSISLSVPKSSSLNDQQADASNVCDTSGVLTQCERDKILSADVIVAEVSPCLADPFATSLLDETSCRNEPQKTYLNVDVGDLVPSVNTEHVNDEEPTFVVSVQTHPDENNTVTGTNLDDIEFIDADDVPEVERETNRNVTGESPNASFTLTFEIASDDESHNIEIISDASDTNVTEESSSCLEVVKDATKKYDVVSVTEHDSLESSNKKHIYVDEKESLFTNIVEESNAGLRIVTESHHSFTNTCETHKENRDGESTNTLSTETDTGTSNEKSTPLKIEINPLTDSFSSGIVSPPSHGTDLDDCDSEDMDSAIVEESNISVALALKLEREKLNQFNNNCPNADEKCRSRSRTPQGRRNIRSASTGNFMLQLQTSEIETVEGKAMFSNIKSGPTTSKRSIKKSSSFRIDRQNVYSPVDDGNANNLDTMKTASKKVSDICRSFVQKARSTSRPKVDDDDARVKSPTPQRKLMKWVTDNGKWLRIPVNETLSDKKVSNQTLLSSAVIKNEVNDIDDDKQTLPILKADCDSKKPSSKEVSQKEQYAKVETEIVTKPEQAEFKRETFICKPNAEVNSDTIHENNADDSGILDVTLTEDISVLEHDKTIVDHTKDADQIEVPQALPNHDPEKQTGKISIDVKINSDECLPEPVADDNNFSASSSEVIKLEPGPIVHSPTKLKPRLHLDVQKANDTTRINTIRPKTAPVECSDSNNDLVESPVMNRNDFLLGIKDNVSRRNLVKMLSPTRTPQTPNFPKVIPEKASNFEEPTTSPKRIRKLTAVKIQEEIFEGKPEYMKQCNIDPLGLVADEINLSDKTASFLSHRKRRQLKDIKKSKTFTSMEDAKNEQIGFYFFDDEASKQPVACENKTENSTSVEDLTGERQELIERKHQTTADKRNGKAPLVLRDRSLQRPKLLSEIVEVEENKDDLQQSATNNNTTQQRPQPSNNKKERKLKKSGSTGNKRRSLSLPTGSLAFGDSRIVYKNGHFTIETMDGYEIDSSRPPDLDDNDDTRSLNEMHVTADSASRRREGVVLRSESRDVTLSQRHGLKRQCAKIALTKKDSNDSVFDNDPDDLAEGSEHGNESCSNSSHVSEMSIDSHMSEDMDAEENYLERRKLQQSSSSLPETGTSPLVKQEAVRARRTSSFRRAQEAGGFSLTGVHEEETQDIPNAKTNQNSSPSHRSFQKRKPSNDNMNLFSKQGESAKDFFSKKMNLKGLFKKNKSDLGLTSGSPLKTQHPVSPPIAAFQGDDDIGSVDTPPGSPGHQQDFRRRHTSADIYIKTFADASASESGSNCPTPTQERHNSSSRQTVSTPTTPSRETSYVGNLGNLTSNGSVCSVEEDRISLTSASSAASSSHSIQSPSMEQPHKPKTPKPVGKSPRRSHSIGSKTSRTSYQWANRDRDRDRDRSSVSVTSTSLTSLESDSCDKPISEPSSEGKCQCEPRTSRPRLRSDCSSVSNTSAAICQFCKQCSEYTSSAGFNNGASTLPDRQRKASSSRQISLDDNISAKQPRKDSMKPTSYEKLAIISQTAVVSSNSNDSGIQRDASTHSSNESIKGSQDGQVKLRRKKSLSPHTERPKSEAGVRWADLDLNAEEFCPPVRLRTRNRSFRDQPRPKSDFDDSIQLFDELFEEILEDFDTEGSSFLSDRMKAFGSEINLQPYCSLRNLYDMKKRDFNQQKNRRMSTPHPIKSRLQKSPKKLQKQPPLVRSSSMPESLDKINKRRKLHLLDFHMDSLQRHLDAEDGFSDDSDLSFDHVSLKERSLSVQSSQSQLTSMDEDEDNLIHAEALWDHITMVPDEIGFRAQDVIEVMDMRDKDWWYGAIDDKEGWFPAAFVRLRVNQDHVEEEDLEMTLQENLAASPKLRRISMLNKNQARTNVVNEIINAEREYVKHIKDVVEGYIQHARKRIEMFPEERIALIFGNIETIYLFAQKFLANLETCIDVCPHLSEIGQCFLDNERGFEVYSDYCNNHPSACEELKELCMDSKYRHFFEACRLLQELVEIPLEGFLLTPVQKICKYPLQLAELLKYTPPDHPDYQTVKDALSAMRKIATLINERKRKMESIEKIAAWQHTVADWDGEDLLEKSSELIFSGDINKVNTAGWSQERYFFLFDHQLIYCKKELLKRHVFSYKGRIDLDNCDVVDVPDGRDAQYNVSVKHAWKLHETLKDKWYLLYSKTQANKQRWLKALKDERNRVQEDKDNDFCVPDHWKQTVLNKVRSQSSLKDKHSNSRVNPSHQVPYQKDLKDFTYSTLPRRRLNSQKQDKKKGWFIFGGKKSKR